MAELPCEEGAVVKRPELPNHELARLVALREHQVLDTGPDEALDAVTRTVARLLAVPIALVSLVDVDRQWFKSRHGLGVSETARDISFCGHVVAEATPLIVRDARADERFADNPLVLGDPKIRFYAGYPLRTAEGHDLGTLCAIDSRPRAPSEADLATLADLSRVVVALLAGHRDRARLQQKRAVLDEQARQLGARAELLATISHEIRTPLHGVVGMANLLAESDLPADQRDLVETLVRSAGTVRRIVDDVLDLARAESNKLPIHPRDTDVWTLLEDVVDLYASEVGVRGVEIGLVVEQGARLSLFVDGTRLQQIVTNLVANAAKFTREGAVVVRVATQSNPAQDRVTLMLAVEDTGPGFPADALERPFAAFSQPDAALARLHGGSGLGLSLAEDLARRMGGELRIDPSHRRGARVVLTLPNLRVVTSPSERTTSSAVRGLAVGLGPLEREALESALRGVPELEVEVTEGDASESSATGARFVLAPLGRGSLRPIEVGARVLINAALPGMLNGVPPGAAASLRLPFRRSRLAMLARLFHAPLEPSTERAANGAPGPAPLSAFVVDDDPTSTRVLAALLRRRGLLVTTFSDGLDALAACRAGAVPDLVFSDLHMPGMNGIGLAARLRADLVKPPRLVVVSASVREEDRRRCHEAGFEAFLEKPLATADLDALVGAASSSRVPAITDSQLVRMPRLAEVAELLGDDALDVIREGQALIADHLETLTRVAEPGGNELVDTAHAIGSASLQIGLEPLARAAREFEETAPDVSPPERVRAVEALRELGSRSGEALERALSRLARGHAPGGDEPLPVVRITLAGDVSGERLLRQVGSASAAASAAHTLLIDGRASIPTDPSVGQTFERWYRSPPPAVARIALLVENRLWIPHIEARARGCAVPMRAFEHEAEALRWLAEGRLDT